MSRCRLALIRVKVRNSNIANDKKQTCSAKGAEILNNDFRSGTVLTETCYSFIMLAIANHAVLDHSPMEVIIAEKVDCGFPVSMDI